MSGARVRQKDNGANALLKRIAAAARKHGLKVGVLEDGPSRSDGDVTNLDIAAFAEFGTETAEPRPWLSGWYDSQEKGSADQLKKIGEDLVRGGVQDVDTGLDRFGRLASGELQQRVRSGVPPPNAPSTVAQKGSSTPLVESGDFAASITHKLDR